MSKYSKENEATEQLYNYRNGKNLGTVKNTMLEESKCGFGRCMVLT
jgi:hypothetical protein